MEITWRDFSGEREGRNGGEIQGIRSINGRYKIDRRRLRYRKWRSQITYIYNPGT